MSAEELPRAQLHGQAEKAGGKEWTNHQMVVDHFLPRTKIKHHLKT